MTRNRALRAIEALVTAKERAVIEAAESVYGPEGLGFHAGTREGQVAADAVAALRDARALLALATGDATGITTKPEDVRRGIGDVAIRFVDGRDKASPDGLRGFVRDR